MDGDELKQRRKELKVERAEFAALLGLTAETVGRMERGAANITESTVAAVLALSRRYHYEGPRLSDPLKQLVLESLVNAGIKFRIDQIGSSAGQTGFYLQDFKLFLVVDRYSSLGTANGMDHPSNVIVAQGSMAVRFLAAAIRSGDLFEVRQAASRVKPQIKRQVLS